MALTGGTNNRTSTATARAELPLDLARHVFGVSLECSRIEKETQACASLSAVRKDGDSADKHVLLLTLTGPAEAVRLAQQIVENRARRALQRMEVDLVQNSLISKTSSSVDDHETMPVEAALADTSSNRIRSKELRILYTREEMLMCLQSPESWKRPKNLPTGNLSDFCPRSDSISSR